MPGRKLVSSMEGKGESGTLPRPSLLDGRISDEVWKNLTDHRRRLLIEIVDRTGLDDKTRIVPSIEFPPEAHFAPAPPGCRFKAMIPSEGYWDLVREQQEERQREEREHLARREKEERARREREEVQRQKREEISRQAWEEAMRRQPLEQEIQRQAMEEEIRQCRRAAARCYGDDDDDGESKRPRLTTPP